MNVNRIFFAGRVGKIELRYTASGKAVATFSVASSEKYGEKETTTWMTCVAWEKTAEFAGKYVRKGARVLIIGKIQVRSYDDKDGNKKYLTEINVNEIQVIDWPEKDALREEQRTHEESFDDQDEIPF